MHTCRIICTNACVTGLILSVVSKAKVNEAAISECKAKLAQQLSYTITDVEVKSGNSRILNATNQYNLLLSPLRAVYINRVSQTNIAAARQQIPSMAQMCCANLMEWVCMGGVITQSSGLQDEAPAHLL